MDKSLLLPIFAQVFFTYLIGFLTLKARKDAYYAGEVAINYFKHNSGKAPEKMKRLGDNFSNQFEVPVLFYLLMVLLFVTETTGWAYLAGAWLFVAFRAWHSWVHVKSNYIPKRRNAYLASSLILLLMWGAFFIEMILN